MSAQVLADHLAEAMAQREPVEIVAGGTKRDLGHPVAAPQRLDMAAWSGVIDYQPEELTLTALAATPMTEIQALLAQRRQILAFEPKIHPGATLGGVVMTAEAGSRRPFAGATRDHVLGFSAVSGRAEIFKAGGKVVKNVTGYDLSKLITGSFGTLAVLHEVTVKVMPAPECVETLIAPVTGAAAGLSKLRAIAQGAYEASGLAYAPAALSALGRPSILVRLEGTPVSVSARLDTLRSEHSDLEFTTLAGDPWAALGHGDWLADTPRLWRLSVPMSLGPKIVDALGEEGLYADWAGARWYWRGDDGAGDGGAKRCRDVIKDQGHATLIRASVAEKAKVAVFEPAPPALASLQARVKAQFDPLGLLNPGRMGEGRSTGAS